MHIIRLRGPWEKQTGDDEVVRVDVPEDESEIAGSPQAIVWYRRNFNRPTGLQSQDRVYLKVTSWTGSLQSVQLNDQPIAVGAPPLEVDITSRLAPHNVVCLTFRSAADEMPRLSGEVSLAIDS